MANLNFTNVVIGGRLTADPELKTTPSGLSVTSFTVAVNQRDGGQDGQKTDFFPVTAWQKTAEFVTRYFHKGNSICVSGTIQNRPWTAKDGTKRTTTEINADRVMFVDSRSETQTVGRPQTVGQPQIVGQPQVVGQPQWEELGDEEELPF